MADILDQLNSLEVKNCDQRYFIPYPKLQELLTRDTLHQVLEQSEVKFHEVSEIIDTILNGGHRLFGLLIAIRDVGSISKFLRAGRLPGAGLDSKLPLSEETAKKFTSSDRKAEQLVKNQWKFLAPVISPDQLTRDLDEGTTLPFVSKRSLAKNGAFGDVYAVRIYSSHQQIPGLPDEEKLVCKQLIRPSSAEGSLRADFEHELDILSALRCLKHPNIIQLITAFTLENTYTFIFPKAETDLHNLLRSETLPLELQTANGILTSLWGLSSALEAVHNFLYNDKQEISQIGCHYDIKPRNILYASGKLILADFGLSWLKTEDEGSKRLFSKGEGFYMAPECEAAEDDFKPGKMGRASDVWSLGCVFTEVLVYVGAGTQSGRAMVEQFCEDRKIKLGGMYTTRPFHSGTGINPAVTKVLDRFNHVDGVLQPDDYHLVEFATLIKSILQVDPSKRPTSRLISEEMYRITQRSTVDEIERTASRFSRPLDLELKIGLQRLQIWREISGLDASLSGQVNDNWFTSIHTLQEYKALQDLLEQWLLEIKYIQGQLSGETRPPFPLYHQLRMLMDALQDTLSEAEKKRLYSRLEEEMLQLISADTSLYTQSIAGAEGLSAQRLTALITMREVTSALLRDDIRSTNALIKRESLGKQVGKLGEHSVYEFSDTKSRVLVEKLKYDEAWISKVDELVERVDAIATLRSRSVIHSTFRVLQCRGYYHDPSTFEFGFVYDLPSAARASEPKTLMEVIKRTEPRTRHPSLTQKFELARLLTSHILEFHRGGWLHKGISSRNIICFPDAFSSIAESLRELYFIGFNNSRNDTINAYTQGPKAELEYQHPIYLRSDKPFVGEDGDRSPQRFRQEFDYYSTGLVLLEIARWKPLEEIARSVRGSPEQLQRYLKETETKLVRSYMGDVYAKAFLYCLTAYDGGKDRSSKDVREAFWQNVVQPLETCLA